MYHRFLIVLIKCIRFCPSNLVNIRNDSVSISLSTRISGDCKIGRGQNVSQMGYKRFHRGGDFEGSPNVFSQSTGKRIESSTVEYLSLLASLEAISISQELRKLLHSLS